MATKLDQEYVAAVRRDQTYASGFDTLVNEVERLEKQVEEFEAKEAKVLPALQKLHDVEQIAHPSSIATRAAVCEVLNAFHEAYPGHSEESNEAK